MIILRRLIGLSLASLVILPWSAGDTQELLFCGSLENAYGPFDYTNPAHFQEFLPRVEEHHFDAEIATLTRLSPGDVDYTLQAFPNHHRALYTMLRYYIEHVPKGAPRMAYSAECYFDRARRMAPNDATVVMLEGIYFQKSGDLEKARTRFERAARMAPESAEIQYNAGLLFAELGEYDQAVTFAKRAYELGYPLPGLRNILKTKGVWKEN